MRFEFTEEENMLRDQIRRLAREKIAPLSEKGEEIESQEIARAMIQAIGEQGACCLMVPEEYGGVGVSAVGLCIVREELSRVSSQADLLFAELGLASYGIMMAGTHVQKQKYLTRAAKGELLGSFALTEPNAGSDVAAISTRARREGNDYVLNGEKVYASAAGLADFYLILAKTDPAKGRKGISAFVVDAGTQGVHINKMEMMAGIPEYSISLEDCRVPSEQLVGPEGAGWDIIFATLGTFRVAVGAAMLGLAQAAYEEAMKYAMHREAFGKPLAEFQATQFKLADMAVEIEAARWLIYRAAHLRDERSREASAQSSNHSIIKYVSMAKLFATEMACRVVDQAVQIHGGSGVTKGVKVERLYREARLPRIYEGTSEIQRLTIFRELAKEF
jgi:alkylation response protein AidB-like acyl-CoA dehydrogenase